MTADALTHAPQPSGWRTIESAPRDGTIILAAYQDHPVRPAYWDSECWITIGCITEGGEEPYHWQPLPPPPGSAPSAPEPTLDELPDLREEVAYWRRDAAARIWSAQALMQAYRKQGRDDLAFAHHDSLRAAVGASEEVQRKHWHSACDLCGKPLLPGEATCGSEDIVCAHVRCAVEDAEDDTGALDPSDAEWRERVSDGRAALIADSQDPIETAPEPAPQQGDAVREALLWALDEIDAISNRSYGFAYPQAMRMLGRADQLEAYTRAAEARSALDRPDPARIGFGGAAAGKAPMVADDLIAIAAFRYALGRMTYMVGHVGSWLIANRAALQDNDAKLIVREIDEADQHGRLGMDVDKAVWMRVRETFASRLDRAAAGAPGGEEA